LRYNAPMTEVPTRTPIAADATGAPRATTTRAVAGVAGALLLLAIALVFASLASYASVKHRLDAYASDHDANFDQDRFRSVVWQIRLLAALVAGVGAAVFVWRRRLARSAEALTRSAAADVAAAVQALRAVVAADSRLHLAALGAIAVAGTLARLDFLFQPMRYDESGTYIHYASQPLYVGLTTYTAPNNHLLNTLLIHLSTGVLGDHPWTIRLPAFVAGSLLAPATYLAGRLLYGRSAALVAAALVASSSTLIEYSTNARGYTGVALVFVLLLALAVRLRSSESPASWAAFSLLGALGLFTIPTMVYGIGAVVVWLAVSLTVDGRRELLRTRLLPSLVLLAALSALLYAPVIAVSGAGSLVHNSFVEPQSWSYFAHHLPSSVGATFSRWHRDQPAVVWAMLAVGFAAGVVLHRRIGRVKVPPVVGPLVFIPPMLALQHVVPFERVWLFLLPLYFITAGAGLVALGRELGAWRHRDAALALGAAALCMALAGQAVASRAVLHSEDTSTFRDAPEVAAFLVRYVEPGDRFLVSPPADLILEYYLDAAGLDAGRLLYVDFRATRLLAVVKEGPREYTLREVIRQHLGPGSRHLEPVLVRRFPHARIYELRPRGT
jgi:4-amino-4-deoxy-L-arabinose transferase-like glycosyltransferase